MGTRQIGFNGRGFWNVWFWMAAGLAFVALNLGNDAEPRSRFWFTEIFLYGLMLAGMWGNAKYNIRKKFPVPKKYAPLVYVLLVWLFGMLFEVSLTVTGEGVGGLHPETLPSFILAQGDYIPIALVSFFIIRKAGASYSEVFFLAGGKSLTEGLVFNKVLIDLFFSSQFWLSPIVLAYYTMAYASFVALPLLFIDEEKLWKDQIRTKRYPVAIYWLMGFALAMVIRIFWGLVYSPLITGLLNLPPGLAD